jgi:protein TonB
MSAALPGEGLMRDGAIRALAIAFIVSILLHAAILGLLPRLRELAALVPPAPVPLIARVVRPAPPPAPPAPVQESRQTPPSRAIAPAPVVAPPPAPGPLPAPQAQPSATAPPARAPEPAPAPAPALVTPAPAPSAPAIDPGALEHYRQGLIGQAVRHKRYPRVAIDNNWEGEVVVRMAVGADGRIAALRVARSSGHEVLDRQALEMFRNAKPLVQIPGELRGREFELELRAVYSLRDQRSG